MAWQITLGVFVVAFALREVFQDMFHPSASGTLSDVLARWIFNLFRRRPALLSTAGPLAIVVIIFLWAVLVCLGFALIYWAVLPGNFRVEGGNPPLGFWQMVYFSLEVMTTLGLGDYTPQPTWLRILVTFEALVGFAILTASVSSIVLIHPALGRMRSLARRVSLLVRMEEEMGFPVVTENSVSALETLAFDLARTRVDFVHFPIIYYFYSTEASASLPKNLIDLQKCAESALSGSHGDRERRAAALLTIALRDLAKTLAPRIRNSEVSDAVTVFEAYARHHLVSH